MLRWQGVSSWSSPRAAQRGVNTCVKIADCEIFNSRGFETARDRVETCDRSAILRHVLRTGAEVAANTQGSLCPANDGKIFARSGFQEKDHFLTGLEARNPGNSRSEIPESASEQTHGN